MKDNTISSRYCSPIAITFSLVVVLLCCGEFARVEMMLKQQHSRIQHLEDMMTSSGNTVKISTKTNKETGKRFHSVLVVKKLFQDSGKRRTQRSLNVEITANDTISKLHGRHERKFIEIIKTEFNKALFGFYKRKYPILIQGPPGPPGKTGLTGPKGKKGSRRVKEERKES